jgi:hypothetical protein
VDEGLEAVIKLPRWVHRIYARCLGYFWLPCPRCRTEFGGHEVVSPAGPQVGYFDNESGRPTFVLCPSCTRRDDRTLAVLEQLRAQVVGERVQTMIDTMAHVAERYAFPVTIIVGEDLAAPPAEEPQSDRACPGCRQLDERRIEIEKRAREGKTVKYSLATLNRARRDHRPQCLTPNQETESRG